MGSEMCIRDRVIAVFRDLRTSLKIRPPSPAEDAPPGLIDEYFKWVTLTMGSSGEQAEVIALFKDLRATLKIRAVED